MTSERSTSHGEMSQDPVKEAESVESVSAASGEPASSANHQPTEASRPESKAYGRPGGGLQPVVSSPGEADSGDEAQEKVEAISTPPPSKIARLKSILGEFGHDELNDVLTRASEGNAARPGEPFSSAGQQPAEAIQANSEDDERPPAERSADSPSRETTGGAGKAEAKITGLGEGELSPAALSNTAMISTLLTGLGHVEPSQVEKLVRFYQSEWQARSQRDQLKRELVLRAERQQAELKLQEERFAAEQAKLEADLVHQQELARLDARRESTGELARSVVLFLVVLAVVLTPLLAMGWLKVPPQSFSQYVAPITGITGTVLGYWFGRQDPKK